MLLLALSPVASVSTSADIVVFDDGRVLEISSLEIRGSITVLELEGGGRIAIPSERIVSVGPYEGNQTTESPGSVDEGDDSDSWRVWAGDYAGIIEGAAERYRLSPSLLTAIARVESNFDPFAVSHKGACGLMQLIPETADRFGVKDVFDPEENLEGGARYFRWLLDRFEGKTELALAAYNAGEQAVERYRGIPPYIETRDYVTKVMERAGL